MKTKSVVLISFLVMSFIALTSMNTLQDSSTFEGKYDGREEYGYSFTGINAAGEEYNMSFHNVEASVLKTFDLNSSNQIGTKFQVTYTTKIEIEKDEYGMDDETEILTIVALKKL
ncbi:hypothetical protein [Psychroserpens algicola]|uniref:Uncharacterized protein n=1 Tax=Psychroserpens algicola TaxID=1719034 RepID=A0ABT0H4T8_9FLAO|nr:hypothetical protein [Psychroserpens algicola]MCK8479404.1 hypothetical protein [Psychroserpens algicola]